GAYRLAVESANPSRLNAFAVLAFCAEITRLPGHCAPRSPPENATAHTIPSRSTMVAHMLKFRPDPAPSAFTAVVRADFSADWLGRPLQLLLAGPCANTVRGSAAAHRAVRPNLERCFMIVFSL